MLRDRLVCGVTNDHIQRRLLTETTLDFDKALNKASSMELAEKNALDLHEHTGVVWDQGAGNKMTSLKSQQNPRALSFEEESAVKCDRCGRTAHNQTSECSARNVDCYICGKKGHFARVCHSKPKAFLGARTALHRNEKKVSIQDVSVRGGK